MERIKWFGGVALAYFALIVIALLVNNPEHNWIYWIATALVIVVLMVFLIEYVNTVNSVTGWILFGTVLLILTIVFVTYLSKFPTNTSAVVLFSTGVGKSVLIFSLFAAAAVLAIRVAFTVKTEPIMFILATPIYISLIALSLCIFVAPFFVIGGLSKLFPDNTRVQALWDLLFMPIYKMQNETGVKEKIVGNGRTMGSSTLVPPVTMKTDWDKFDKEEKPKARPKSIPPVKAGPSMWDKVKDKFKKKVEDEDDFAEPVKQKVPPIFEKKVSPVKQAPKPPMERKEFFTDAEDDF